MIYDGYLCDEGINRDKLKLDKPLLLLADTESYVEHIKVAK